MNGERVAPEILDAAFPDLAPFGELEPLTGGTLNFVWRVICASGSVVVKYAPAHVATVPDIALGQGRLLFEARALRLFDGGSLAHIADPLVRPPRILGFDRSRWLLVEEDVGPGPDLAAALHDGCACSLLGTFIGALHAESLGSAALRQRFQNVEIQRTRLKQQYAQVAHFAERAGAHDADALGAVALELGKRWTRPGRCLVMGDLWPPSVLVRNAGLRVIDWELVTYGSPAQDVAHLLAHLLMLGEARGDRAAVSGATRAFAMAYRAALGPRRPALWDEGVMRDASIHFGCELLARTFGPFQSGGPLAGHAPTSLPFHFVTQLALSTLRNPRPLAALAQLQS